MSITRSIFDGNIEYTIVGHAPNTVVDKPAIVLLNRSPRMLRTDYIAALVDAGYREIVSVEQQANAYSVEALSGEFATIRFVLLRSELDVGTRIALAFSIVQSEHVLVLWSTIGPPQGIERAIAVLHHSSVACVAPLLRNDRGEALPVQVVPAITRRSLRVLRMPIRAEDTKTLFPSDYVGLYHRARFFEIGGFDRGIETAFWQLTDFGFRSYMWGYSIPVVSGFRVSYRTVPEPVDETVKPGYARFYARNLACRMSDEGMSVPRFGAIPFAFRSGLGLIRTIRVFNEAREWVSRYRDRFRIDARTMIDSWSIDDD